MVFLSYIGMFGVWLKFLCKWKLLVEVKYILKKKKVRFDIVVRFLKIIYFGIKWIKGFERYLIIFIVNLSSILLFYRG